jgi:arginyl-tRNA--protein-N-Asp/Glu arginylyltransferase
VTRLPDIAELARFKTSPRRCSYVAAETASLTYRIIIDLSMAECDALLSRGWRRFGCEFFRPACPFCAKCRPLRVKLDEFKPSRSQRRVLRRNTHLEVTVQVPTVTADHVQLYNAYHRFMHEHRGWPAQSHTPRTYYESFLLGTWDFAREFLYYDRGRLMGVGLADVTHTSLSSVYFFHHPAWRAQAPGVFSVLQQIDYARRLGLRYQYLGFWIPECPSMAYKSQYRPHEILSGYPADTAEPVWGEP